jgi:hypothetical protein
MVNSKQLFTAFHDLYRAYYYQSKGCSIVNERNSLEALFGPHKHLCSYFKECVGAFNALSKRSKTAFEKKWLSTFGETVTDNYNAMKSFNKAKRLAGCSSESTSVNDTAVSHPVTNVATLTADIKSTLAKIESHPAFSSLSSEVLSNLEVVKGMVSGDIQTAIESYLETTPEPTQDAIDAFLETTPEPIQEHVVVAGCSSESVSVNDTVTTVCAPQYSILSPIVEEDIDDAATEEFNPFLEDDTQQEIAEINRLLDLDARQEHEAMAQTMVSLEDQMFRASIAHLPGNASSDCLVQPSVVADSPRTTDVLFTLEETARSFQKQLYKPMFIMPSPEPVDDHPDSDDDDIDLSDITPQNPPSAIVETLNDEVQVPIVQASEAPYEDQESLDYYVNPTSPLGFYNSDNMHLWPSTPAGERSDPSKASPLYGPENRSATPSPPPLELSHEPPAWSIAAIPKVMKAAAEPSIAKEAQDFGRNSNSKLSNRLHWPGNQDDRKGLYVFMLLNYTPFSGDLIWIIYSFVMPEEINLKQWLAKYNYWRNEMYNTLGNCDDQYSTVLHLPSRLDWSPLQRDMANLSWEVKDARRQFQHKWLDIRKHIIERHVVRREEEIGDMIEDMKQQQYAFRKRYRKLLRKEKQRQLQLVAAAEPVIEKRQDPDNDVGGCTLTKDAIVLGNIEQYMDENGLSDTDFQPSDFAGVPLWDQGCEMAIEAVSVPPLVPVVTVPVVWACPEARTQVRLSREPPKPLPTLNRKQAILHMLLNYTPFSNDVSAITTTYALQMEALMEERERKWAEYHKRKNEVQQKGNAMGMNEWSNEKIKEFFENLGGQEIADWTFPPPPSDDEVDDSDMEDEKAEQTEHIEGYGWSDSDDDFGDESHEIDLSLVGGMFRSVPTSGYEAQIARVAAELHRPLTEKEKAKVRELAARGQSHFAIMQAVNILAQIEQAQRRAQEVPPPPPSQPPIIERINIAPDLNISRGVFSETGISGVRMPAIMFGAPKATGEHGMLENLLNREYAARMHRERQIRPPQRTRWVPPIRPPPTVADVYVPVSPQRSPSPNPFLEDEDEDFNPLAMEEKAVEEEEEEFNPFLEDDDENFNPLAMEEESPPAPEPEIEPPAWLRRPPSPPRNRPVAPDDEDQKQNLSDYFNMNRDLMDQIQGGRDQHIVGDIEFGEEAPGEGQGTGWVVQFGKNIKPITFEEDVFGRTVPFTKKKMGRPKKLGPPLPTDLRRRRGRPKGAKNKPKPAVPPAIPEDEGSDFNPFADLPIYERPQGINAREFKRRQRQLEKQLKQIRKDREPTRLQRLLAYAQSLNEPGLSDHIRNIYRKTTEIDHGRTLTWYGLRFDMIDPDLVETAVQGSLRIFQRQTQNLENYVRTVLSQNRQIVMWRMVIVYDTDIGQHVTSTTWAGDYQRMYNQIQLKIANIIAQYGEENVSIKFFETRVRYQKIIVGGLTDKQYIAKFGELERDWVIINPRSRTNCLWTAISIASGYAANDQLIHNCKAQNQAGLNLKRRVGTRNPKGGTDEDLQKCANYKNNTIIVHDLAGLEIGRFVPTTVSTGDLHLLLNIGHYHAMLPASDAFVQQHKAQIGEAKKRSLKVIKKCDKTFEARRIVTYDLESYRLAKDENDPNLEVEQVAYACGWAFETKSIQEEKDAEEKGYEIIVADVKYGNETRQMVMAYKRELGDDCLDTALDEWMHNPMFDQSVIYAHNGGKFDLRLIMGQSNLMYADRYVIDSDKLIELNARIINMDVINTFQVYKETNAKGKEYDRPHRVSLRDSIPLFGPGSGLAKLTEELDVPHKKMKELLNVHDLQNKDTWRENWFKYDMDKYLVNDVIGLLEVLTKFNVEVTEGTEIPITAVNTGASLSKKYFLKHHYHNTTSITVGNTVKEMIDPSKSVYSLEPEMDQFIRNGYGGGRCEAFRVGVVNNKCYYYDFTSLYPDVGRLEMPMGQPKWICEPTESDVDAFKDRVQRAWQSRVLDGNRFGTTAYWNVRIRSANAANGNSTDPLQRKPLFGMKEEGMYVFRWYSEWTDMTIYEEEILFAMENKLDYEFEPINGIVFEKGIVLKDCMEQLFIKKAEAKAAGKPGLAQSWKIIINSLYGVWGLKVLAREGIEIARPEYSNWAIDMVTEKLMDLEKIGKYVVTRRLKDLEVKDCNVALAAAVTSEARMKLYRLMMDIQDRGGEIYYCDTDSIVTSHCIETDPILKDKWIGASNGKDLGSLKNEIEECYEKWNKKNPVATLVEKPYFERAVFVCPKMYYIDAENGQLVKKAHKGYRENKETGDLITYERMYKLVDRDIPEYERRLEQETYQWLGGNADVLKNQIGVRIVRRFKSIQGLRADGHPINKGILNADGQVVPYVRKVQRRKIKRSV